MDVNYYKQYEPIFGAWKIKRKLGEGNFGAVYEIEREDFGTTYHAALKTITIPKNQAELDSILDDGMDATSAESYLEQFVEKIVSEFVLMSKLKGNSHIVSYEDHQVIRHKDGIGWDILIRMELLTPMMTYMKTTSITKRDVIKLGIDMCRALELCQKYNIIHRDIKPENIFISDSGDFKLGDFGIAKEVEKTQSGLTKTGTQTYMAPEVYKGQPYGSSVDLYSLGVVLYRLLNHNRAPFMPQYPEMISYSDRERALIMRMGGHRFPAPSGVEEGCRLAEIAMKACSFHPDDRYSSPTQMREDLEAILYSEGEGLLMFPSGDALEIKSVNYVSNSKNHNKTMHLRDEQTELMDTDATEVMGDDATEVMEVLRERFKPAKSAKAKKKPLRIVLPILAIAAVVAAGAMFLTKQAETAPSVAVASVQELAEPIEFKLETPPVANEDYAVFEKRLEAYGKKYYFDRGSNTAVLSKADLGASVKEILATINMLTGKGEIAVTDAAKDPVSALKNSDFATAVVAYDEAAGAHTLTLEATETGAAKLQALSEQVLRSENGMLLLSVDGNVRVSVKLNQAVEDGKLTVVEKDSESESTDEVRPSAGFMKLIASFVNDGMLTASYQVYLDEKYGLTLQPEKPLPEPVKQEEVETPTVETPPAPVQQPASTPKKTTGSKKTTATKTQQKPAQQPTQQPAQQQTTTTPPASNDAGMPEIYIDFD